MTDAESGDGTYYIFQDRKSPCCDALVITPHPAMVSEGFACECLACGAEWDTYEPENAPIETVVV